MSSPTDRMGLDLSTAEHADGRAVHSFRQSWLGTLDICPERARHEMAGTMPRGGTDATDAGTAFHAGIEYALGAQLADVWVDVADMREVAQQTFTDLVADPAFRWVQMSEQAARSFIDKAIDAWARDVWPTLEPLGVEVGFGPLVVHEDDQRVIQIAGTIDYVGREGVLDWKTAGSEYKRWERDRWSVQAAVYTLAARHLMLDWADLADASQAWLEGTVPFEYVVAVKPHAKIQRLPLYRHQGHWDWLVQECIAAAHLIEAQLAVWPKNDSQALCSAKWCGVFDQCKGRHFDQGWPQVDRPAVHI